jgi:hypothetical protein
MLALELLMFWQRCDAGRALNAQWEAGLFRVYGQEIIVALRRADQLGSSMWIRALALEWAA